MPILQSQVDLSTLNTLHLPSIADKYIELDCEKDVLDAFQLFPLTSSNIFVLGGGSNVILPPILDQYILSFKIKSPKDAVIIEAEDQDFVVIDVEAGVEWDSLVDYCVQQGYSGLENLSLIPGTVGASPIQNIGAYGVEVADVIEQVKAFNVASKQVEFFSANQCQFAYRDSFFKRHPGKYIITSVRFRLSKHPSFVLEYGELHRLKSNPKLSALLVRNSVIETRQQKLPDPKVLPNVGSFFKNPIVPYQHLECLKEQFPDLVYYPLSSGEYKLAAAWLIDQAGWKGYKNKVVGVHDKQALVIVNHHQASQADILSLARSVQSSVASQFKVSLEIEPVIIKTTT